MRSWIGITVAGVLGLGIGLVLGGGAGGLVGSGVGALSGAHLGACKAGIVAVDKGLVDEATANKIVVETLAAMRAAAPEIVETIATDLAGCRAQKGIDMLGG